MIINQKIIDKNEKEKNNKKNKGIKDKTFINHNIEKNEFENLTLFIVFKNVYKSDKFYLISYLKLIYWRTLPLIYLTPHLSTS